MSSDQSNRVMEEIKLYWLIQFSVASAIGFLCKLVLDSDFKEPSFILLMGSVCSMMGLLLIGLIGFTYNITGNFFIYKHASSIKSSIVTPIINHVYLVVTASLGAILGALLSLILVKSGFATLPSNGVPHFYLILSGAVIASLLFYFTGRAVVKELVAQHPDYASYQIKLSRFYFVAAPKKPTESSDSQTCSEKSNEQA